MRFVSGTSVSAVVAVLLILSLLPIPVLAQNGPTISVEPQTVSTYVGNTFSVDVWIRRVSLEGLARIEFKVVWASGSLQLVNCVNHVAQNSPHWEIKTEEQVSASYLLKAQDPTIILFPNNQYALHDDMSWATLTFRCTGQGDTTIDFPVTVAPNRWGYWSDGSDSYSFEEYLNANVHQTEPIAPVGGFMEPVNKAAVFAPYLALFGLVAAVAVVVAKSWKKPES
jgi:hypothetical protein